MALIDPLETLALSDLSLESEEGSVRSIKIGMDLNSSSKERAFHIAPSEGSLRISYCQEPENETRVVKMREFAGKGFTLVRLATGETYKIHRKPETFSIGEYTEGPIETYFMRRKEILRERKQ